MMRKIIFAVIVLVFVVNAAVADAGALRVIVNKKNSIPVVNTNILKKIYLGKKTMWPDNKPIVLVALKSGDLHSKFLKLVVKQNARQFDTYWKKARFTGTGVAPQLFSTEDEVKKFVSEHPEAIGYVSQEALDETIKRIPIK